MRYSIAHEIAHTFFVDCKDRIRHRNTHGASRDDEWQLETLCNVAAAELLMPVAPMQEDISEDIGVEDVLQLSRKYDASVEAVLIRICHLTQRPMIVFVASKHTRGDHGKFSMDYVIPSRAWRSSIEHGFKLPQDSAVSECTAIGYTAKSRERWKGIPKPVAAEYVGLPPYPGSTQPRVAGIATLADYESTAYATLEYLRGDALSPRGEGPRLIAHIVNDRTANWGGNGFAAAVKRQFPGVQQEFRDWTKSDPTQFELGRIHVAKVEDDISSVQMIAQSGYGKSAKPRIRYQPLQKCLETVADLAMSIHATVHMPRIGMGHARGQWPVIEDILYESLVSRGVSVSVYDLPVRPGSDDEWKAQASLAFE